MKKAHFTRQERHTILWLRFLAFAFLLTGLVFLFHPSYFLNYLDSIGLVFFGFQSQPLQTPRYEIWWILTLSLMGSLFYCAFRAQSDWIRLHSLVPIIILSKGIAAAGFLALLIFHPAHFFYIVAFAVDALLCFITTYAYTKAIQSRSYSSLRQ